MVEFGSAKITWRGYYPGVLGEIIRLHATYYHDQWGFDISFETQEGKELCEFMARFNPEQDGLWTSVVDGRFAGSVAIDGQLTNTEGARLRWFIVDSALQGMGIGKVLMRKAIEFCRVVGHRRVYLWTFQGLEAARGIYEREGFVLSQEREVIQWGRIIKEQRFDLML